MVPLLLFLLNLIFIDYHLSFLDNPLTHLFVRMYCVAIDLMAQVKCYRAVLEVSEMGSISTPDLTWGLPTAAEPWGLGAPMPIGMPDNCCRNAAPVLPYLGRYGHVAGHHLGTLCC